jgi:hypothetical protein
MKHARPDYEGRFLDLGAPGHPDHVIPEDEPVLIVRGQDKAAPATARAWADENDALGGDSALSQLVRHHAVAIEQYQERTGRSKIADMPASSQEAPKA